jgi:hypothetical protein
MGVFRVKPSFFRTCAIPRDKENSFKIIKN